MLSWYSKKALELFYFEFFYLNNNGTYTLFILEATNPLETNHLVANALGTASFRSYTQAMFLFIAIQCSVTSFHQCMIIYISRYKTTNKS